MNTRCSVSRTNPVACIESLESRQLLSASAFGTLVVTKRFDLDGEVAGRSLVNDRFQAAGPAIVADVASSAISPTHLPGVIVRWGDGTAPLKTTALPNGDGLARIYLSKSVTDEGHSYRKAGTYKLTVQLTDGKKVISTLRDVVHVSQNSKFGVSRTVQRATGFSGSLGALEPMQSLVAAGAHIDWGDGTTSDGMTTQADGTQNADVTGSHKYAKAGVYRVSVQGIFAPPNDGQNHAAFFLTQPLYSTITVRR